MTQIVWWLMSSYEFLDEIDAELVSFAFSFFHFVSTDRLDRYFEIFSFCSDARRNLPWWTCDFCYSSAAQFCTHLIVAKTGYMKIFDLHRQLPDIIRTFHSILLCQNQLEWQRDYRSQTFWVISHYNSMIPHENKSQFSTSGHSKIFNARIFLWHDRVSERPMLTYEDDWSIIKNFWIKSKRVQLNNNRLFISIYI
jgi:hypothetical protein